MKLFTEQQVDEINGIEDRSTRIYEAARHMAAAGLRLFPARPFNQEKLERALAEVEADRIAAQAEGRKAKYGQKHHQQFAGKMPVFDRDQYGKATDAFQTIDQWWHPDTGRYRGHNICLATGEGSGIIVIDIDVKNGEDGWLWWNEVTAKHPPIDTLQVRTGGSASGQGMHMYFKYRPDAVSNKNGLATGIDFRTNAGHVMAPFSECYSQYEIVNPAPIAEMPDWLFEEMFGNKKVSRETDFDDEQKSKFEITPLDQIAEMLGFIHPIEHEGWWASICFAIKSEHDTDEGFDVLDQWSQQDPSEYDRDKNRDFWDRGQVVKAGSNSITISTLYHYAEECGWHNPRKGVEYVSDAEAVRMMNRSFAIIDPDQYMRTAGRYDESKLPPGYCPSMTMFKGKTVFNTMDKKDDYRYFKVTEVTVDQVNKMTAGFKVLKQLPGGKTAVKSVYETWMQSKGRKAHVATGFYVDDKRCPKGVFNVFPGWAAQPKEGFPERFITHIREFICNGDEEQTYWILNRLAYMIQFGDEIMSTALVITGPHGSGKSIIGDYMERVLGSYNYLYLHDAEALKSRFSEELVGKFMIVADEAIFAGDPVLRNKLKSMISAKILREEGKGKAAKAAQNVMFLMVLSNEDEPVGIEPGDRRFSVLRMSDRFSNEKVQKDPELRKAMRKYFNELMQEMNGDGPDQLLHMLMLWDVDKAAARTALQTKAKDVMQESRQLSTNTMLAYMFHLWSMGYSNEDPTELNAAGEHWGGRVRTGIFHDKYCEWVKEMKTHHRNSDWRAESTQHFSPRMVQEFGCRIVKPQGKSYLVLPDEITIRAILEAKLPETMKNAAASEETDF